MRRIRKRTFQPRGIIGRHRSEHPRCLPERGNSFVSCHDCRPDAGLFQRSAYVGSCEDQPDDGCSDQMDKTARTIRLATASDDPWLRSCIKGPCITASLSSPSQAVSPLAALPCSTVELPSKLSCTRKADSTFHGQRHDILFRLAIDGPKDSSARTQGLAEQSATKDSGWLTRAARDAGAKSAFGRAGA